MAIRRDLSRALALEQLDATHLHGMGQLDAGQRTTGDKRVAGNGHVGNKRVDITTEPRLRKRPPNVLGKLHELFGGDDVQANPAIAVTPTPLKPVTADRDRPMEGTDHPEKTFDTLQHVLIGQGDARGDFTVIVDPESETLEILETAQKADSLVYIYYRPDGTGASKPQDKIPAYITGLSYSASVDGRVEAAVTFVAGGNVDSTAQASV